MKKILIAIGIIVAVGVSGLVVVRTLYPDNVAETAPDGGAKGLKTRVYKADLATVAGTVEEVIPTLSSWGSNWKIVNKNVNNDSTDIKAEVPVVFFTDDLEVRIKRNGETVAVDVRSASRVGKSDFGENRRHVVQLLEALDAKLN